jgi:hypothetical protein
MRMRPMAMGMEVVPTLSESRKSASPGMRTLRAIPRNMAANIQTVRYLVRKDSFWDKWTVSLIYNSPIFQYNLKWLVLLKLFKYYPSIDIFTLNFLSQIYIDI